MENNITLRLTLPNRTQHHSNRTQHYSNRYHKPMFEKNSELTPYQASPNAKNLAQWLAFIRLFCYVRTPACIYSKMETPYSHRTFRTTKIIPVPPYVSNILCDIYNEHTARDATSSEDAENLLFNKAFGEIITDVPISSTYKPRGLEPYGISKYAVLRVGDDLVRCASQAVGCAEDELRVELVKAVTHLGRGAEEPGPLWWPELVWLESHGGQWLWNVLIEALD